MDNDLRIRLSTEGMSLCQKECAEFLIVIYLAVEYDPDCVVFIAQRLMATRKVNNREPAKSQAQRTGCKEPFVIWSTMKDRARHLLEKRERHNSSPIRHQFSADPAHSIFRFTLSLSSF